MRSKSWQQALKAVTKVLVEAMAGGGDWREQQWRPSVRPWREAATGGSSGEGPQLGHGERRWPTGAPMEVLDASIVGGGGRRERSPSAERARVELGGRR
ncbi:hypothetical protein GUJ93_ZPchr0013g37770 [Zizania palustris]|uniref:Uncharacterized protein n=1 Tax=Zizania palustris TaxID=103762 RepID=A0A8J5XA85_ZIZPA|nr:hypothetical protein GUJ93_ZPchr0013g37770 [Zizania palustris]